MEDQNTPLFLVTYFNDHTSDKNIINDLHKDKLKIKY